MSFVIDQTLEISAPPEIVWQVITDLEHYGEWNPFVVSCRSTLRPGDPIDMQVKVFSGRAQAQRETVFEHVPGRKLCYGLDGKPTGAVRSMRCHLLESAGGTTTVYRSHFELSGWLAPVLQALLGRQLRRGFSGMTDGIGKRAEQLWQQRRKP